MKEMKQAKSQTTLGQYDDFYEHQDKTDEIPACGANLPAKGKCVLRLGSQNVRKMEIGDTREGCPAIGIMKTKQLDIAGLQETNKNWSTEACRAIDRMLHIDGRGK